MNGRWPPASAAWRLLARRSNEPALEILGLDVSGV
jgi:hypothetical protein